jgi:hypothetical protein
MLRNVNKLMLIRDSLMFSVMLCIPFICIFLGMWMILGGGNSTANIDYVFLILFGFALLFGGFVLLYYVLKLVCQEMNRHYKYYLRSRIMFNGKSTSYHSYIIDKGWRLWHVDGLEKETYVQRLDETCDLNNLTVQTERVIEDFAKRNNLVPNYNYK